MNENEVNDSLVPEEQREEEKIADIFHTMKVTDEAGNEAEQLMLKNDNYVQQESEYPPEAVQEWEEHKIVSQEGGTEHE